MMTLMEARGARLQRTLNLGLLRGSITNTHVRFADSPAHVTTKGIVHTYITYTRPVPPGTGRDRPADGTAATTTTTPADRYTTASPFGAFPEGPTAEQTSGKRETPGATPPGHQSI